MTSSPQPPTPVDPAPSEPPRSRYRRAPRASTAGGGRDVRAAPRYSPVVLTINVAHLLQGQGLVLAGTFDDASKCIRAATDLLIGLGVEPDLTLPTTPPDTSSPALAAAAVLLRAAGIEPAAVLRWPRRTP
jgi:hypothetical protein